MRSSMISLISACWLILCFVCSLQSEPQTSYWSNDPRIYHPGNQQYRKPSIQRFQTNSIKKKSWNSNNYVPTGEQVSKRSESRVAPFEEQKKLYKNPIQSNSNDDRSSVARNNETRELWQEAEMIEKMNILEKYLSEDPSKKDLDTNAIDTEMNISEEAKRVVRQVRNQKPGFFWTLARVTFETFNETRSAIKQISNIINNNVQPDTATSASLTASSTTTMSSSRDNDTMETTTMAPTTTTPDYVLTRGGLQSLIRRNVLGLVRLFNIEWRDALNQSEVSVREFRKQLGNQVGSYLQDNPNAY